MADKTGGPAFPGKQPAFVIPAELRGVAASIEVEHNGMTLRDYFAAKAMQGFASDDNAQWVDGVKGMASCAYMWADAMLKERDK